MSEKIDNILDNSELLSELYHQTFGFCGCSNSHLVVEFIFKMLASLENRDEQLKLIQSYDPDVIREFVLSVFDSANLIEHGTSIAWPWLTDTGKAYLEEYSSLII